MKKKPTPIQRIVSARMKPVQTMLKMHVPDIDGRIALAVWLRGWLTGALMEYDGSLTIGVTKQKPARGDRRERGR